MFEKAKKFCKENAAEIAIGVISGTLLIGGIVLGVKTHKRAQIKFQKLNENTIAYNNDWAIKTAEVLQEFEPEYKDGYSVPFVTKEMAQKFLEKMGDTYQVDIFDLDEDCKTSCIWIS